VGGASQQGEGRTFVRGWSRTVNGNDSSVVTIPVNFTYTGIGAAGRQLLNTGGVNYHVSGEVTVGTVVGNFGVPYSATGRFNALGGNQRQ